MGDEKRSIESPGMAVWGALVAVQVFFGVHYVAAKFVFLQIPAGGWAVIRIVSAAILLQLWVALFRRQYPKTLREWLVLSGFALCGVVFNQILFVEGLARTSPAHSSLINTTIPLWTFLFIFLFRHEAMTARKLLGLAIAFGGVVFLQIEGLYLDGSLWLGDLLTALNSISYGLFLAVSRRYLMEHDPLATIAHVFTLGAIGVSVYGLPILWRVDLSAVSSETWAWGVFIVLFPTIGSYFLNYWALRRVRSSVVALFIYLQPLIATVLAALLLKSLPRWPFYVAAAMVFLGVGMAIRDRRESKERRREPVPVASNQS